MPWSPSGLPYYDEPLRKPKTMTQTSPAPRNDENDEIDLIDLWMILVSGWRWIVGATTLGAVGAIIVALQMTPIYQSQVVMVPAGDSGRQGGAAAIAGQFGAIADLAGVNLGGSSSYNEALAILKSRALVEGFIKDKELLPILFEDEWDAAAQKWKATDPEKIPTIEDAYKTFSKNILKISEERKTGVITLAVEWKDRQLAAEWANELVRRANAAMRARAIADAQASINYLQQELAKTSVVEIQQTIYRLLETNYKTVSIANTREEYAFKIVDPAVVPERKVRPKRAMIVIISTLFSGLASVLGVFMYHSIQNMKQRRAARM